MISLNKSQKEEFDNIDINQPVFAGKLISHDTAKELCQLGLVMFYEDDEISGYVLTEKGKEYKQDCLNGAFEVMANGVLYKPKGCKQSLGTYRQGCGECGKGSTKECKWN